tara:strand:+ start:418 stop:594 length:177 start_codon:yes stop_codon:yes gene_type:complete
MKEFIKYHVAEIITVLLIWMVISFMGSIIKSGVVGCDKTYAIDYIVYADLFCEIKSVE